MVDRKAKLKYILEHKLREVKQMEPSCRFVQLLFLVLLVLDFRVLRVYL